MMKCTIPEIYWHNRDPVLSIDIQKQLNTESECYRLASGGSDSHVLIWHITFNDLGSISLDLAADLTRHQRAVNVVKWSPNGKYLASGDDESVILIWKMREDSEIINILDNYNDQDKECWLTFKVLRGHLEDVYDLSWSPNSLFIASASIDNTAIIWDIQKGKSVGLLDDHKSFVQGVAWDPKNQYIATLCTDRYLRIFDIQTKKVVCRTNKCILLRQNNIPESEGKMERIFHDDTLQTFFRRLSFSPDGNLLVTPAGIIESDQEGKSIHTTYIFSRASLKQPAIILPSPDDFSIVVSFCPLLFKHTFYNKSNLPIINLPYRMVFAVATKKSVYLYDTQQKIPFGIISNIHYTRLTDMAWSKDGKVLAISSTDGFCSLLTFSEGELGEIYDSSESAINGNNNSNYMSTIDTDKNELKPKKSKLDVNKIVTDKIHTKIEKLSIENINDRKKSDNIDEEAMHSWQENCKEIIKNSSIDLTESEKLNRLDSELTEDIRLFYEESQEIL